MSVSAVSGNSNLYQMNQTSSVGNKNTVCSDCDGDSDGSRGNSVGSGGRGGFMSAVMQALSQLGSSSNSTIQNSTPDGTPSSTAGASSTNTSDPQAALNTFMHDLSAALHAQGGSGQGTPSNNSGDSTSAQSQGHHHHHHGGGGMNAMEGKLQNLIQQLSTTDPSQSNTNTPTPDTASTDSAVSTLQNDFKNLLNTMGISGSQTTLDGFLKSVSQNIQNPNHGVSINTQA